MNENDFKAKIMKDVKSSGNYIFKYPAGRSGGGVPDMIGCIDGMFYGIEAKVVQLPERDSTMILPFENLTKLQFKNLVEIKNAGGRPFVITKINGCEYSVFLNIKRFYIHLELDKVSLTEAFVIITGLEIPKYNLMNPDILKVPSHRSYGNWLEILKSAPYYSIVEKRKEK
jgi:Holliday junction resolvase